PAIGCSSNICWTRKGACTSFKGPFLKTISPLYEIGKSNPHYNDQQLPQVEGMPLGRFKKDDGGNVEEYPYGQGGQQMPIILQPGQFRGKIASQGRHQGKGPHKQQGTAQTELGVEKKDAQDDGNGQFVDDDAVQYGGVTVNGHPFHQGM